MSDFGQDVSMHQGWTKITGKTLFFETTEKALTTPPGGLWYDPTWGFDLRGYLNKADTAQHRYEIETLASRQLLRDERFRSVDITLETYTRNHIRIRIDALTALGPFSRIFEVSNLVPVRPDFTLEPLVQTTTKPTTPPTQTTFDDLTFHDDGTGFVED